MLTLGVQMISDWRDVWKGTEGPLWAVGKRAGDEVVLLKGREKIVNDAVRGGRGGLGEEIEGAQAKLEEATRRCDEARSAFDGAKTRYGEVRQQLEEQRELIEETERGLNDSSGVARLKAAIKSLRREAARIGLDLQVAMHMRASVHAAEPQARSSRFLRRLASATDDDEPNDEDD